jgi:hypothetical protein
MRTARGNSDFDLRACAPSLATTQQCATGEPSNPWQHILRSLLDHFCLRGTGPETPTARLDKTPPISTSSPRVSKEGRISIAGLIIPRLPIVPAGKSLPQHNESPMQGMCANHRSQIDRAFTRRARPPRARPCGSLTGRTVQLPKFSDHMRDARSRIVSGQRARMLWPIAPTDEFPESFWVSEFPDGIPRQVQLRL